MNNYDIIWSPTAKKDLYNIYNYIVSRLKETNIADSIIKRILTAICNLETFPEKYPKIFYFKNKFKNIRKLLINPYVVIYEINNISRGNLYFTHISL